MPIMPERLLNRASSSSTFMWALRIRWKTTAGSMSPVRPPIIEALERGQAHGGLDRLAGDLSGGGSAVADVQHDLLQAFSRLADDVRHHGGDELVGGAVGAVAADVVLIGDFLVQRVGAGGLRQLEEEGGIEDEDLRNVRQQRAHDFGALGLRAVVQRGEHSQILDLG